MKTVIRKTLAAGMAVWLSGIVFLFCCEGMQANSAAPESCPLARMHSDCDKASDTITAEKADGTCGFLCNILPVVFDKARKVENVETHIAATVWPLIQRPSFGRFETQPVSFIAVRSRIADRHGTYLANRVFRI